MVAKNYPFFYSLGFRKQIQKITLENNPKKQVPRKNKGAENNPKNKGTENKGKKQLLTIKIIKL